MLLLLKIVLVIFATFTAIGIACAVRLAFRRAPGIGVHGFQHPRHVDPYSTAFGDVPYTGFTKRQLEIVAPVKPTLRDPSHKTSAGVPQRTAAGGRPVPSGTFARRTLQSLICRGGAR